MKIFDKIFIGLLTFGVLGHLYGTFTLTEIGSNLFVWLLAGGLAAGLIVTINILRHIRPDDYVLARVALVGSVCWIGIAILFGLSIGNVLDPRALAHAIAALGLAFFSFRTSRFI